MKTTPRNTITVGDHDFTSLTVKDWISIPEIPTNRDSHRRVNKMSKVFNTAYDKNQTSTLTEVALGIVTKDFIDPDSGHYYRAGEEYSVDGNTRKHYWKLNPDRAELIKSLTAKIHYLASMDDVNFAYYPYNNAKSAEKASEILQGLRQRYNWLPKQSMFQTGGYKTALDWACTIPGEDNPDIFKAFNEMFPSLKIIDGITSNEFGITKPALKDIKSQPIIAAFLLMLKINPDNLKLHDMIYRLSTITYDETKVALVGDEVDAVQIIALEWSGLSVLRNKSASTGWLNGMAKSTKFASKHIQLDFLVYWIQQYIANPKLKYKLRAGIKPTMWEGAWTELFPEDE